MQASLQSTLPASTIFESWLPMDSETSRKGNCSASLMDAGLRKRGSFAARLVLANCDTTTLPNSVEEPPDQIASAIKVAATASCVQFQVAL
jgi:hypothetical protein